MRGNAMTAPVAARMVRIEHVVNLFGEGAAVSLPIVVSDSRPLLRMLLSGLGSEDYSPMEWDLCGRNRPFVAWECAHFNRAAGLRLRQHLRALVGARWCWRPALRTRKSGAASGRSGRVDIPIERLWMARFRDAPGPVDEEYFHSWGGRNAFRLWNDGLIAMDISRVRGIADDQAALVAADIAVRLLAAPDVWSHMKEREGFFEVRVSADLADLLDDRRALQVQWKPRKRRGYVADVTTLPAAGERAAVARAEPSAP